LTDRWRATAEVLRRYGAGDAAAAVETCAGELADVLAHWNGDTLTLVEAARESGFSERHLRRLISNGTIPNAATEGFGIRRGDLPRKPHAPTKAVSTPDFRLLKGGTGAEASQ
jgi:hypothetical protein